MTNALLAFHLLGAVCFLVGGIAVGVLQLKAIRQERPSQVYGFLRLAPFGAAVVGTGALLTLGFGIAVAEHEGIGLKPVWIQASLGLWALAMVLGALGGRTARRARHLAKKLAAEGDEPSPELRARVGERGPLYASYASFVLLLAIVVLMVWQPGSSEATPTVAFPKALEQQIHRDNPQIRYLPTRLPTDVEYSGYTPAYATGDTPAYRGFNVTFKGPAGHDVLYLAVYPSRGCHMPPHSRTTGLDTVNSYRIAWARTGAHEVAWRCVTHGNSELILEAVALTAGADRSSVSDLETAVAYAAPVN